MNIGQPKFKISFMIKQKEYSFRLILPAKTFTPTVKIIFDLTYLCQYLKQKCNKVKHLTNIHFVLHYDQGLQSFHELLLLQYFHPILSSHQHTRQAKQHHRLR